MPAIVALTCRDNPRWTRIAVAKLADEARHLAMRQ
jgi:hypothetical protein